MATLNPMMAGPNGSCDTKVKLLRAVAWRNKAQGPKRRYGLRQLLDQQPQRHDRHSESNVLAEERLEQ